MVVITCEGCGTEVEAVRPTKRFCAPCLRERVLAQDRASHRRGLLPHARNECENCGATWMTGRRYRWCPECRTGEKHERPEVRLIFRRYRHQLAEKYGMTPDQWVALAEAQGWRCALCPRESSVKDLLQVDHCHETNKVRGLLCGPCNRGIGLLGDTVEALQRAADYLRCAKDSC